MTYRLFVLRDPDFIKNRKKKHEKKKKWRKKNEKKLREKKKEEKKKRINQKIILKNKSEVGILGD